MSVNPEAVSHQGEFHSRVPRDEPLTTKGVGDFISTIQVHTKSVQHKPGVKVGNDAAPEFHAQAVPEGTAPADRLFTPNTQNETPGQAENPDISKETWTSASDTIGGATSADVHTGLGKPVQGETSNEIHGKEKKERSGLEGAGASVGDSVRDRALDIDAPTGVRGKSGEKRDQIPGAEERVPESAETVAAERA